MSRALVVVAALVLAVGCSDPEPVATPDLVGMALDDARAEAEDFELEEVDATGKDRGVWSPANWTVQDQDPAAGTPVEPGTLITVSLINVRDVEDDPDPSPSVDEPEPDEPDPDATEEPTREAPRDVSLEADVSADPLGLRIVAHQDVHDCKVDLNSGIIRSGYTTRLAMLVAGEPYTVPWGDLTDRDGERFDYSTHRPETVTILCENEDGEMLVDTWGWE